MAIIKFQIEPEHLHWAIKSDVSLFNLFSTRFDKRFLTVSSTFLRWTKPYHKVHFVPYIIRLYMFICNMHTR